MALIFLFCLSLLSSAVLAVEVILLRQSGVVLRGGPGNFHPLIAVLDVGAKIEVTESPEASGWVKVNTEQAGTGWISANALATETAAGTAMAANLPPGSGAPAKVRSTSLTAMIKGLSASAGVQVNPAAVLNPSGQMPVDSIVSFRRNFAVSDLEPPIPASERGLMLLPEIVAAAPVIASEITVEWGGEAPEFTWYCSQVLLWLADRAGANSLTPGCYISQSGANAVSLPGGWIIIGGDLFSALQDESELAGILSHELAHCVFNHGRKAMERESWRVGVDEVYSELEAETHPASDAERDLEAFAASVRDQARRRWTIGDELQADSAATIWLGRSGYDIGALQRVLLRLRGQFGEKNRLTGQGDINLAWINSRDELDRRIAKLDRQIARMKKKHPGETRFSDRFSRYTRR
jgi:hypothetical protein